MKWKLTWKKQEAVEVGVLLLLLTVLSAVVFGGWLEISAKNYPIAFICGPIVIWTAFRFTQRETATGIFILSVIAVWGTVRGFGPFVGQNENQSLLTVQSWTAVLAITAMALSAGMAERRRVEDELQQQKSHRRSGESHQRPFPGHALPMSRGSRSAALATTVISNEVCRPASRSTSSNRSSSTNSKPRSSGRLPATWHWRHLINTVLERGA